MTLRSADEYDFNDFDPDDLGLCLLVGGQELTEDLAGEFGLDTNGSFLLRLREAVEFDDEDWS